MKEKISINLSTLLILALLFAIASIPVFAQEGMAEKKPTASQIKNDIPQIGGTITQWRRAPGVTCADHNTVQTYATQNDGSMPTRYCTSIDCMFYCPMDLPSGAKLVALGADVCDSGATGQVQVVFRKVHDDGTGTNIVVIQTGDANTPGCYYAHQTITWDETIDNGSYNYYVVTTLDQGTSFSLTDISFGYQYQVAPAPSTATFTDVPTSHMFFQFIEALAASGITSGCTSTAYCPNSYVTRGQMAVFLGRALGLGYDY